MADCPATVEQYLILRLGREPWEVFAVLFLYCRHRLQAFKTLFQGMIDNAIVHPDTCCCASCTTTARQ
ncbi:JAB domain-containing protein [Pseudomonas lurida]|uniref:JAB domain-containing protein n=1 Tax=Pseudomonas lurida TaxID=244566 RepID=UPI003D2C574C